MDNVPPKRLCRRQKKQHNPKQRKLKKNKSNMKKILSIFIFVLCTICNVMANTNDVPLPLVHTKDSVNVEIVNNTGENIQENPLWSGILSSMIATIATLLLFFTLLRPRLKIQPILAFHDVMDKETGKVKKQCEVLICNKNIFACNDIRVEISIRSFSKFEDEGRLQISQEKFLTIAGCLHDNNASSLLVPFEIESIDHNGKILFPKCVLIELLAQHSLSGVILPTQKVFTLNEMQEGQYIKSTFIERGKTYKQAIMKSNICALKRTFIASIFAWIVISILILKFLPVSWMLKVFSMLIVLILMILGIIIWQLRVYTNANAFNHYDIMHVIKNTIIRFHQYKHKQENMPESEDPIAIEDVTYDETK